LNNFQQSLPGIFTVFFLSPKTLCLNDNDTFGADMVIFVLQQAFFIKRRQ
jgi:hypothetical protein